MSVTSSNSATYTNLKPGNYTFMVQALTNSQKINESNIATYNFSVAFPFWQTYWFYGLVVLSLVGMVYGYIKIRLGFLEKHRLKELVDEQTKDLQQGLGEKEVLIKEIHHRVKNNQAVISGLLELQRGYAEDEFSSRVLSESQRRVQSISMIHEKLYQNEQLEEINFEKYVRELVDIIAYSFDYNEREIEVDIDIDDFKLGVDQGIPCGLILNELVSNAYEHAFTEQTEGAIEIAMKKGADNIIRLTVADNGKGLPDGFDIGQNDTLGLTLIETLSTQLEGSFTYENTHKGACFKLEFEKEKSPEQIPTR
jgi:two-component sensor histidine kinase